MKRRKHKVSCIDAFNLDTFFYSTTFNNDYIENRLRCISCWGHGAIWIDTKVLCPDCGYFDKNCWGHDHKHRWPRGTIDEANKS